MIIDPRIKHVGTSKLRGMHAAALRELKDTLYVIQDGDEPIAVLVGYELYMQIQETVKLHGLPSDVHEFEPQEGPDCRVCGLEFRGHGFRTSSGKAV